jgi:hypothetical protein
LRAVVTLEEEGAAVLFAASKARESCTRVARVARVATEYKLGSAVFFAASKAPKRGARIAWVGHKRGQVPGADFRNLYIGNRSIMATQHLHCRC